jgi:hypothetical protein
MLSVLELFRRAEIEMRGPVRWSDPIPEMSSGIYVVALVDLTAVVPEKLSQSERDRWNLGEEIIYIGKAKSLRQRLQQFYRHVHGRRSPHRGGQDLKLLQAPLQVYWGCAADCAAAEGSMIDIFYSEIGKLPFANKMRGAQRRILSR